jgi:glyceraldehyde 3-phosphate dehydrogenase
VTDTGLVVDGDELRVLAEPTRPTCRGASSGVDVVIESTGSSPTARTPPSTSTAARRRSSSPRPAKGEDITVGLGVNFDQYDPEQHHVISNASCTTNCLAPFAKVANDTVGIKHGLMTTIHAYTADQRLQDLPHSDLRRARAAALNLVPTSTGAAKAVGLVLPELNGKLHGYAIRAPVPTGSVIDLTFEANGPTSVDAVNGALREAAEGPLKGIMAYTEDPIVSTDIVTDPHSAIVDGQLTAVIDETLVKVVAWYDNEWGYSNRLADLVQQVLVPATTTA